MGLLEVLLESWRRQARIVDSVAGLITDDLLDKKGAPGEWDVATHLCHIPECRGFWLSRVSKPHTEGLLDIMDWKDGEFIPVRDLAVIRGELKKSALAVEDAVRELVGKGVQSVGGYDHPVLYLQHMLWHEGWHVGILMLTLRQHGVAPSEEWECEHIWDQWRIE